MFLQIQGEAEKVSGFTAEEVLKYNLQTITN
jgi:hypothetical protein